MSVAALRNTPASWLAALCAVGLMSPLRAAVDDVPAAIAAPDLAVRLVLSASAPAPGPDDIPWLLLDAQASGSAGALAGITAVQRVQTAGGKAPAGACAPEASPLRVHYTATYRMLGATAP